MNKTDFITSIAQKAGVSKADAANCWDAIEKTITGIFETGDSLTLSGFIKIFVSERSARTGRNPSTGKAIEIPAAKVPTIRVSPSLKMLINMPTLADKAKTKGKTK